MRNNILFKGLCFVMVALTTMVTTSCKDEPDKFESTGGVPTVHYIRPVSASSKDQLLVEASMGTTVCIVGENLRSVKELYFNDCPAVLNTSYMTDNTLIVTIPKDIPGEVTDKIYFVTTGKKEVEYDFHVIIPGPMITSMSNEWASEGEEVTIIGDYFLDYEDNPLELSFGDYVIDRDDIKSITKNAITFTMPAGVPHEKLTVTSVYGSATSSFMYMDNRGMLFDFDTPCFTGTVLGNNGWHGRDILSDDTSLSGNYMVLGGAALGEDGGWDDGHFSFEYWCGDWETPQAYSSHPRISDLVDFSNPDGLILKFEINIPEENAWSAAPIQIYFGSVAQITGAGGGADIYGNTTAGANNTFFHEQGKLSRALYMPWKDEEDLLYDTKGKWMTVTIPLSDFVWDWDGSKISSTLMSPADFGSFNMFVVRGGYNDKSALPEGVACEPVIKIDNIRVIPNK